MKKILFISIILLFYSIQSNANPCYLMISGNSVSVCEYAYRYCIFSDNGFDLTGKWKCLTSGKNNMCQGNSMTHNCFIINDEIRCYLKDISNYYGYGILLTNLPFLNFYF